MKEHLVREISPKVSKKDQMYHTSEKPNSFHGLRACLGLNEMNSSLVVFYKIWQNLCLRLAREQWLHFTYK